MSHRCATESVPHPQMCEAAAPAEGFANWRSTVPNCRLSDYCWLWCILYSCDTICLGRKRWNITRGWNTLPECEIWSSVNNSQMVLYCTWLIKPSSRRLAITQTAISPPHLHTLALYIELNRDLHPIMRNVGPDKAPLLLVFCCSKCFSLNEQCICCWGAFKMSSYILD